MHRSSLLALVIIGFCLGGCFEKQGALAVSTSATASTITWSTNQGTQPALSFTIRNDDTVEVKNMKVTFDLAVTSGESPNGDATRMKFTALPSGVTGSNGTYVIASLAGHSSVTFTPDVWLEPGTYVWTATVDPEKRIKEFNEKDNKSVVNITVNPAPAVAGLDITMGTPTSITPNADGETMDLVVPVTVTGPAGAKASMVRFNVYLYGEPKYYFTYQNFIETSSTPRSITLKGVLPPDDTGTYEIQVDEEGYITETNETNNVITVDYPLPGSG